MELEESRSKRVWPKILIWFAVALFVAATLAANIYHMKTKTSYAPKSLKTAVVTRKTMKETTIASGEVEPAESASFNIDPSKGEIVKVYVQAGDQVEKGDKLFRYDGKQLNEQLQSLKLKKQSTQMQIDHRASQISDLNQQISDKEDQNAPDSVISSLKSQKDDLSFQNQLSEIDLQQTRLQIQQIQNQLNELVIKSTMDGKVQSVATKPYNGQEPIVTVVSAGPYEVKGSLTEYDVVHVKEGQSAMVQAKALDGHNWKGTVVKIGNIPESTQQNLVAGQQQSVSSYPFTVALKGTTDLIRPGYHVNVEITIKQHENVPVVPMSAILSKGSKSYVFVVKNGKLDKREIETGLTNGVQKEVIKGLRAGEKIVIHPTNPLKEGMVIRHDSTR
ncbi:MAG TPA: efflux RND transporter periplasmic adaptor subunit [Bacillales bacterium]|nr:efflux RND transporter periplasmic adaptor subunit [Bacillales bacterium]